MEKKIEIFYGEVIDKEDDRIELLVCLNPEDELKKRVLQARWFGMIPFKDLIQCENGEVVKIITTTETGKMTFEFHPVDQQSHKHYFEKPDYFEGMEDLSWMNTPE